MGITGRPLRGSRLSSFYPQAPAEGPSLTDLDSAFQLQEYIALLIRRNPHDVETIVSYPGPVKSWGKTDDNVDKDGKEVVVDQNCWIYEQLRYIFIKFIFMCLAEYLSGVLPKTSLIRS